MHAKTETLSSSSSSSSALRQSWFTTAIRATLHVLTHVLTSLLLLFLIGPYHFKRIHLKRSKSKLRFYRASESGAVRDLAAWEQTRLIQAGVAAGRLRDVVVVHHEKGSRVIARWWDAAEAPGAVETLDAGWRE
ncbi:hypothetical protein EDC01DRAFT_777459 [Geopyxis carbonaria]|nr:hypothetical protein EDC01DRAFT_777459 [Geopyxis carbonaria]